MNSAKNTISSFNLFFTLNQSLLFGRSIVKAKKILREKKNARTNVKTGLYTSRIHGMFYLYVYLFTMPRRYPSAKPLLYFPQSMSLFSLVLIKTTTQRCQRAKVFVCIARLRDRHHHRPLHIYHSWHSRITGV